MNDRIKTLEDALKELLHAVCGDTGFAACVRADSGKAYPWPALEIAEVSARAALAASQPAQPVALTWPARCDGVEQDAFEAWAKDNHYDMELHPLHWLFLDARTSAARDGWAAGLAHAVDRMRAALDVRPHTVQDAARWQEVASKIWQIANCTDPEDPEFTAALRAIAEGK